MSTLAERIKAETPAPPKQSFNEWLISLDAEDTAAVEAMAVDRAWTHTKVHAFISKQQVAVSKETVTEWRFRLGYGR